MELKRSFTPPPLYTATTATERGKQSGMSSRLLSINYINLCLNTLIVLTCVAICLVQSSKCLSRFLDHQTKAIMSLLPTGNATFVGMTICPRSDKAYNDTVLEELGITADDYRSGHFYGNSFNSGAPQNDGFGIFDRVTFELAEIMHYIKINTADTKDPSLTIYFSQPLDDEVATWSVVYDSDYGRCYSMKLSPRIYVQVGKMLFIDLTHELTVNTLENNEANSCSSKCDFSYDDCIMRGLSQSLMSEFGCVVPFVPAYNGTQVCRFDTSTQEGQALQKKVTDRYSFLTWWTGQRMLCPAPCSSMETFLGVPFGGVTYPYEAKIRLYTKSTVKVKKTVWDYTWVSMLAEVGGYTGLLLGISVVNITDALDWIRFKCF